jgi:predicted transcriptional regulator
MRIAKAQLIKLVENLPETVEIEEVLYRLALREKLDAAEEDVRAGRTLSEDEVTAEIAQWFTK